MKRQGSKIENGAGQRRKLKRPDPEGILMATDPPQAPAPELKLEVSTQQDCTLVVVHGPLTSAHVEDFKGQIRGLIPISRRLVIDLCNVSYMDSSGLGGVVGVYVTAKTAHCEIELANLSQHVRNLLSMTNLLSLFESCGQHNIKLP
jgi:anti-sigma B factor antagonist